MLGQHPDRWVNFFESFDYTIKGIVLILKFMNLNLGQVLNWAMLDWKLVHNVNFIKLLCTLKGHIFNPIFMNLCHNVFFYKF